MWITRTISCYIFFSAKYYFVFLRFFFTSIFIKILLLLLIERKHYVSKNGINICNTCKKCREKYIFFKCLIYLVHYKELNSCIFFFLLILVWNFWHLFNFLWVIILFIIYSYAIKYKIGMLFVFKPLSKMNNDHVFYQFYYCIYDNYRLKFVEITQHHQIYFFFYIFN